MTLAPRLYRSPIRLAEGVSGKVTVSHAKLKGEATIVGMRQALLRGVRPCFVKLDAPLRVHELREDGGLWMSDSPEELNQIACALHDTDPRGDVLVGGLGLGIMATTLATRALVETVTVIEKSLDVIALCYPPGFNVDGCARLSVIHDDIGNYLKRHPRPFDAYMLDTWTGTGEATWWTEVLPLRRIIANKFGRRKVHCWAEDIMAGQIIKTLTYSSPHWLYSGLPLPMKPEAARRFVRDVGLPAWEKRYGQAVDAALQKTLDSAPA